jgi:hypothetical protein
MNEVLVVLAHDNRRAALKAHKRVKTPRGQVKQQYGPEVLIVEAEPDLIEALEADRGVAGVFAGHVPEAIAEPLDATGRLGILAWNQRHSAEFLEAKEERRGEGLAWDHPGFEPEGRPEQ